MVYLLTGIGDPRWAFMTVGRSLMAVGSADILAVLSGWPGVGPEVHRWLAACAYPDGGVGPIRSSSAFPARRKALVIG